jgi:hypothetical protein
MARGTKLYKPHDVPDEAGIYGIVSTDANGAPITVSVFRVEENGDVYLLTDAPVSTDDHARRIIEAQAAVDGISTDKVHISHRRRR